MHRVWNTYTTALREYNALLPHDPTAGAEDPRTIALTKAAKFLRDTAENAIQYLSDKQQHPGVLSELNQTLETTKAAVVGLSGGKKRKFDDAGEDEEEEPGVTKGPAAQKQKKEYNPWWKYEGGRRGAKRGGMRRGGDYWKAGDDY